MDLGFEGGLDEITLLRMGHLSRDIEFDTCHRPASGQFFTGKDRGRADAVRGEPDVPQVIRQGHGKACGMGGGNQFAGICSSRFLKPGPKIMSL